KDMDFEIEMAATPMAMTSIDRLNSSNIFVNLLADLIPVSYTRCCHTAKYYKRTPKECGLPCREMLTTERTHRWMNDKREVVEIPEDVRKIIPKLLVWGNSTFSKSDVENVKRYKDNVKVVIFDYRVYGSLDTLVNVIDQIGGK
ncbi:MAG: hypothetical protein ACYDG2_19665, partial [Ruminiclostridium sp.]